MSQVIASMGFASLILILSVASETCKNKCTAARHSITLHNEQNTHTKGPMEMAYSVTSFESMTQRRDRTYEDVANGQQQEHSIDITQFASDVIWRPIAKDTYDPISKSVEDVASNEDYTEAERVGIEQMNENYLSAVRKHYSLGLFLGADHPAQYVASFNGQSKEAKHLAAFAYAALQGSTLLLKKYANQSTVLTLSRHNERRTTFGGKCPQRGVPQCLPVSLRYRTADGSCNNLRKLWWGSAMSTMIRFRPAAYHDGIQEIRRSTHGHPLPSPRDISSVIHEDKNIPLDTVTHMLMQWGQFVDHDITATAQSTGFNGVFPQCCLDNGIGFQAPEFMHPDCLPISVSQQDRFLGPLGVRCLEFVRSSPAPRENCDFGPREQLSQVTSYLDASMVYGSSVERSDSLRLFRNGHDILKTFDLQVDKEGYYKGYDATVDATIENAFSTAAYRFGHSMVQKSFIRVNGQHQPVFNNVTIHNEFNNRNNLHANGAVDRLLLGLVNQPCQRRDEYLTSELTNHLFQTPSFKFGMDLASINIQRGRDHGIPPYTEWRSACGLTNVKRWTDFERVTSAAAAHKFRQVYLSVKDIDLFSAGLAEKPIRGGLVGPIFACIIAQQFSNLRKGDRFWFENENEEMKFTPLQLQQIKSMTLAKILCHTTHEIETIQPFVFLTPDSLNNQRISCDDSSSDHTFNFDAWAEHFFQQVNESAI